MKKSIRTSACLLLLLIICCTAACKKEEQKVKNPDDLSGRFINMRVGSAEAVITGGETYMLSAEPFADGENVYIPLDEAAAVFGCTVTQEADGGITVVYDETLKGTRYQKNMTIHPDKCQAMDNISGEQVDIASMGSTTAPVLNNNRMYVPDFYFDFFLTQTYAQHDLRTGWITISNFDDGQMLAGFTLEDDFLLLDEAVRNRFAPVAEPKTLVEGELYETIYTDGTVELGVRTGSDLPDGMHSMIHSVKLLTDAYATPRGLRVGDPVERCCQLYGSGPNDRGQVAAGMLHITQQDGIITGITCFAGGS